MTPDFRITAEQGDITARIKDRLEKLRVLEHAGQDADMLEITLDDRDHAIALPRKGMRLELAIGYKETGLVTIGKYTVDEIGVSGPPDSITIRARAPGTHSSLKARFTRSYDELSLGFLAQEVAGRHGLQPALAESVWQAIWQHADQTNESDLHFLTRLSLERGFVSKVVGEKLIVVPEGEGLSASGKPLGTLVVKREEFIGWQVDFPDREAYGTVAAYWDDLAAGMRVQESHGSGEPIHTLPGTHPDSDAAMQAAISEWRRLRRGTSVLRATIIGAHRARAEMRMVVQGLRPEIMGDWSIVSVEHEIGAQGWITFIEAEMALKEEADNEGGE